jgi:tellurite resistance protein TerC
VDLFYIPTTVSLAVIATILTVTVVASLRATRGQGRRAPAVAATAPFRTATDEEMRELEPVSRRGARTPLH